LLELESGAVDALTFMGKSPDRERYTTFLDGNILSKSKIVLFRRAQRVPFYLAQSLANLKGKKISVKTGFHYSDSFNQSPLFERIEVKSYKQMFDMVYLRRVDFGVVNLHELRFSYRTDPKLAEIEFISPPVSVTSSYLGFSKNADTHVVANDFSKEILKLRREGFVDSLYERYGLK
jgi:polar amino acid transport system substrate-binding protein